MGVNRTIYDGFLARDPVLFEMKSGKQGCIFSCIWSKNFGNINEICDLPVVCYQEARAKAIVQYCKKGSRVQIDGHLVSMPKKTKGGEEYKETQLKIDEIFFISSKADNTGKSEKKSAEKKPTEKKTAKKKPSQSNVSQDNPTDEIRYFDPQTGEIQEV
jgi:single-stranded DNA-binding protein